MSSVATSMDVVSQLHQYLETLRDHYRAASIDTPENREVLGYRDRSKDRFLCVEDLVLQYGAVYTPSQLPHDHGLPRYPKACFQNARTAAVCIRKSWVYVEGYAVSGGSSIHHAWLTRTDAPGCAFDPTWNHDFDPERVYLGIPVRREYVVEIYKLSKQQYCGVFDAWWAKWPILTGKVAIEDVRWKPTLAGLSEAEKPRS
jgi:hypothetical protein